MAIEAALWRDERRQERQMRAAWYTAALTRAKKLPSLKQFMTPAARPLKGKELVERRKEFRQMSAAAKSVTERLNRKGLSNELPE